MSVNIVLKQSSITSNTSLVAKDISANEGKFATLKTVINNVVSDVGSKLKTLEDTLTTLLTTDQTTSGIEQNLLDAAQSANTSAADSLVRSQTNENMTRVVWDQDFNHDHHDLSKCTDPFISSK